MSIHIYKNNPTAGGTDGQQVSEGDGSNPITIGPLNADNSEESAVITLGIRCDSGMATIGNTVIALTGTTANKWALSADGSTFLDYGASLTITSVINDTNALFYAKAVATIGETPVNDTSAKLQISTTVTGV